ncbi:MAG: hypothetical protein ACR2KG_03800 [Nocardioidaceae bacterium]
MRSFGVDEIRRLQLPHPVWIRSQQEWRSGWLLGVDGSDGGAFLLELLNESGDGFGDAHWLADVELADRRTSP